MLHCFLLSLLLGEPQLCIPLLFSQFNINLLFLDSAGEKGLRDWAYLLKSKQLVRCGLTQNHAIISKNAHVKTTPVFTPVSLSSSAERGTNRVVRRCLKTYVYAVRAMKAMKREGAWTSHRSRRAAADAARSTRSTKASSPSSTPAKAVTAGEDSMELADIGAYTHIYIYTAVCSVFVC